MVRKYLRKERPLIKSICLTTKLHYLSVLAQNIRLKKLLTLLLVFTFFNSFAQQVDWFDSGGGGFYDVGSGITSDKAGNSYAIGTVFQSIANNARFGNDSIYPGQNRSYEGWIAKYTLQGNREWILPVGGTGSDLGTDIELDSDTTFIAVGLYTGSNATFDTITGPSGAGVKLFIAQFDTGANVQWMKAASLGSIAMSPFSRFYNPTVSTNDSGDVYVSGVFRGQAVFGTDTLNSSSSFDYDVFLAKYDVNGNYRWSMRMGGTSFNYAGAVACDNDGNAYVSGQYSGTMSIDTTSITSLGSWDGYLAKINDTAQVQWAQTLGGTGSDDAFGIAIDRFDNLFLGGRFSNTASFDTINMTAVGTGFWASDIFVTRWNTDGEIQWAKQAGGTTSGFDYLYALDTDDRGNVGITGQFGGTTATFGSHTVSGNGAWRAVYFALADSTGDFTWAVSGNGSSFAFNQGNGISVDSAKNIYVTGQGDPPLVFGDVVWATGNGLRDAFVVKVSDCSEADTAEIYSQSPAVACSGDSVKLWSNNLAHLEYRWLYNGNGIFLASDSTYKAFVSGTFKVAISDDGCKDTSDPVQVTIHPLPNVNMSSLGTICVSDGQQVLNAGTPVGGVYKGIGVVNDTVFDPNISGQGSFLIWYVYENTTTGCSDSTFGQIVVSSAQASLPLFPDMCDGEPAITLSGGTPLGGTYFVNGTSSTSFDPGAAGAGDHNIEYVVFNGPCSDTALRVLHVDTSPSVSMTSLSNVCVTTASVVLSGGTPAGGTFSGPGVAFGSFFPSFAGGAGTYTITYTYTDATGCDGSATESITVEPNFTISFNPNTSFCEGAAVDTLSATPLGGTFSGPGVTGNLFNPVTAGVGSHNIQYNYANFCKSDSSIKTVVVNAGPTVTMVAISDRCFASDTLALTQGSPVGGTYSGPGVVSGNFISSVAGVGTHSIKYIYTDGSSCTDSATTNITVDPQPSVSLASLSPVCADASPFNIGGNSPIGGTFSGTGMTGSSFNPTTAGVGTHPITYSYTDGNGCTDSASQNQVVNALPIVTFGALSDVCENAGLVALTQGSPSGGTYSGSGVTGNNFNPAAAGMGTTTLTYTYTDGNSCSDDSTSNITVDSIPNVTLGAIASLCEGSTSIGLSTGSPAGGTYFGTGVSGTTFNPSTAGAGTHTISYAFSDGNSCSDTATTSVTVFGQPSVSLASLSPVCADASAFNIGGNSPLGGTFSGTGMTGSNFNPSTAGVGSHPITYTFTDGNGCTDSASQNQVVNALPTVTFGALSDVCLNGGLLALTQGSPTGGTYSGTGVSGSNFNPAAAGVGTTTITYSYTDGNSCSDNATSNITVDPLPNVTLGAIASLCEGSNAITLTTGSPVGGNYFGTGVSGTTFNPTTAGAGTHTISYAFSDGNSCSDTTTTSVVVFGQPSVTLSTLSPVCADASPFTIGGNSPAGGTFSGNGLTGSSFNPATAGVGTHPITYTYTDGNGCTDSASQNQVVDSVPVVTFSAIPSVCENNGLVSLTQGSPSGGTYSGTGVSGNNFNPTTSGAGTFTLTYSFTDGNSCSSSDTEDITVDTLPSVSISAISDFCFASSAVLLSQGSPSGGTYFGSGVTAGIFDPSVAGVGTHSIGYSITNGNGCSDTATTSITVNAEPTVSFSSLSDICLDGLSFALSGGAPSGGTYSGLGVSSGNFNPSTAGVGSHSITYVFTDGNSCTDSASQNQVVDSLPIVNFASLNDICLNGSPFSLTQGSPSGGTYSGTGVSSAIFHPGVSGAGTFSLSYSYTDGNSCSASSSTNITVDTLPLVTFAAISDFCAGDNSTGLTQASPSGGTYFGSGVTAGNFDPSSVGAGSYTLSYYFTDANSCRDTAAQSVTVNPQPTVSFASLTDVCVDASSFVLSGGSPSGGTYSGTAVTAGNFDPITAGVGTISLSYIYTDGNSCTDSASQNQVVDSLPIVTFSSIPNVCLNGAPVTLSQGLPTGGSYSGTGVTSGVFNPATAGVGSTNLSYSYTDGNGCSSTDNENITVDTLPSISFGGIPDICFGSDPVALTQGSPSSGNYFGNGVSNDSLFPATAGTGSHILGYYWADGNGCSDTAFSTVQVTTQPTVTLGSFSNVCANSDTFTLTGGSPLNGTYSGVGVSAGIFDPVIAGAGSFSITYLYTDGASCSDSATQTIVIDSIPLINFTALSNVCDSSPSFTLSSASPLGGTYSGAGVSGGSFDPSAVGPGVHAIQYAFTDGNTCSDSVSQNITIDTLPLVSFSAFADPCFGDTPLSLTQGLPAGGVYSGTGISSGAFDPSAAGAGSHLLTYTFTDGNGCVDSASYSASVNARPSVSLSAIGRICLNEPTFELTNGLPVGGSYSGIRVVNDSLNASLSSSLGADRVYYKYTDLNGCTDSTQRNFRVDSVPNVQLSNLGRACFNSAPVSLTQGVPSGGTYSGTGVIGSDFDPSIGLGSFQIQYSYTDGNSCSDSVVAPIQVDTLPVAKLARLPRLCQESGDLILSGGTPAGGSYFGAGVFGGTTFNPDSTSDLKPFIYYAFIDVFGCGDTARRRLSVDTLPIVSLLLEDTLCRNYDVDTLRGGSPFGGIYKGDGVTSDSIFDPSSLSVGAYNLTYTVTTSAGCTDSAIAVSLVHPDPTSSWNFSEALCENDLPITLRGGAPNNGYYFGPGVTDSTFNPGTLGVGNDTLYYTAVNFCGWDTTAGPVAVFSKPSLMSTDSLDVCSNGGLYALTLASPSGGKYLGDEIIGDSIFDPSGLSAGIVDVLYAYSDGLCSDTISNRVVVNPIPDLQLALDTTVCAANDFVLRLDSTFTQVVWNSLIQGNALEIEASSLHMGQNSILVEARKDGGLCVGQSLIPVAVFPCATFEVMPNPSDGDFSIQINALEAEEVEISIQNAIGQVILSHAQMLDIGLNKIPFDLRGMDAGLYIIHAKGQFLDETKKVFVK